jgi:hypothetical protein
MLQELSHRLLHRLRVDCPNSKIAHTQSANFCPGVATLNASFHTPCWPMARK